MSRLVIDVSGEQHQQIKALAALQGKTIKDFILEKIFTDKGEPDEQTAWKELEKLLLTRIENAKQASLPEKTFEEITTEVLREEGPL